MHAKCLSIVAKILKPARVVRGGVIGQKFTQSGKEQILVVKNEVWNLALA